jgi:hypothetical protein
MQEETSKEANSGQILDDFTRSVAHYFKTYLESGFRVEKYPARLFSGQRLQGLPLSIDLSKYPQLHKNLYKNVISGFAQEAFVIGQNKYIVHKDEDLLQQVEEARDHIASSPLRQFLETAARTIDTKSAEVGGQYDLYLYETSQALQQLVQSDLVGPLLRGNQDDEQVDREQKRMLQAIAAQKLYSLFSPSLEGIMREYVGRSLTFEELHDKLRNVLDEQTLRQAFKELAQELSTVDAYTEAYHLHLSSTLSSSKTQYLHFIELQIGKYSFPLFYTPVTSKHSYPAVTYHFSSRLYVNLEALEYAVQEFTRITKRNVTLPSSIPAFFSVGEQSQGDILEQMQRVVDITVELFELGNIFDLNSTLRQYASNPYMSMRNTMAMVLFDSGNISAISQYQEILHPGSRANTMFTDFMRTSILEEPIRYNEEIIEEWKSKSVAEKLITNNPIPLNDEQRQALLTLGKQDSKVVVVSGAPGTGKSHFVSGVIAQSFLENFSTLVLSDKPDQLDKIETQVLDMIRNARGDAIFHNPMLRLGQEVRHFTHALDDQVVEKIRRNQEVYSPTQPNLQFAIWAALQTKRC